MGEKDKGERKEEMTRKKREGKEEGRESYSRRNMNFCYNLVGF